MVMECHNPMKHRTALALRDLDTGLFFNNGQWAREPQFAQQFPNQEAVKKSAIENKIKNAEIVYLAGDPLQVTGGTPIQISN